MTGMKVPRLAGHSRLAFEEGTQPFFVLWGNEIIVLGYDGPFGVDIQRDQLFCFKRIGTIAEGL